MDNQPNKINDKMEESAKTPLSIEDKIEIIKKSEFFDPHFYLYAYRDIASKKANPYQHYVKYGAKEGRFPAILTHSWFRELFEDSKKDGAENPVIYIESLKNDDPALYEQLKIWKNISLKDYNLIKNSEYFDEEFYKGNIETYKGSMPGAFHYLLTGCRPGVQVSSNFNHAWKPHQKSPMGKSLLAWERNGKHVRFEEDDERNRFFSHEAANASYITPEHIKRIINNPELTTVSFDIFDTLLFRPVFQPQDIFSLMDHIIKKKGFKEFSKKRARIEAETGDLQANIDEIYEYLRIKYKFSYADIKYLKETEINLEKTLLARRQEMYEIYKYAKSLGKRVICISDMYFSGEFLDQVLKKNGYDEIDAIYVSNESGHLKGNTGLFKFVLKEESIEPAQMVHIGDSMIADYYPAQKVGITPIYYPKAVEMIVRNNSAVKDLFNTEDVFARMIIGFVANKISGGYNYKLHKDKIFENFEQFFSLGLYPLLLGISLYFLNSPEIQKGYKQILFASRDGYRPKLIYDILATQKSLPAKYMYAGRRAYSLLTADSFIDYLFGRMEARNVARQKDSFLEVLKLSINDNALLNKIVQDLKVDEETICPADSDVKDILAPYIEELEEQFESARQEAINYYKSLVNDKAEREVVFDVGYSGTVARHISPVIGKPLDKAYLFSLPQNRIDDARLKTKTYDILKGENIPPRWTSIIYEELFGPMEGGCTGFKNNLPLLEDMAFSEDMETKFEKMDDICISLTKDFTNQIGEYIKYFLVNDYQALQAYLIASIYNEKNEALRFLEDIEFPDPISNSNLVKLSDKISAKMEYPETFLGTSINELNIINPWNLISPDIPDAKIGIHLHAFNTFFLQEFLAYISDFPYKFDLFVTVSDKAGEQIVKNLFRHPNKNMGSLEIRQVKNRGRDIGPWILGLRDVQDNYDLFLHVHEKCSSTSKFGTKWRQYLFDNLLSPEKIRFIIPYMLQNPDVGCIFPTPFPDIKEDWINHNVNPFGHFGEKEIAQALFKKMGIDKPFTRESLLYSVGTMLWYRPKALKQLFTFPLKVEDFKAEPCGVGGTIGHAIERMIGHICKYNGFEARMI